MRLILCHVALVRALHSSQRVLKRRDIGGIAAAAALGTRAPPAVAVPPACDDAVSVMQDIGLGFGPGPRAGPEGPWPQGRRPWGWIIVFCVRIEVRLWGVFGG